MVLVVKNLPASAGDVRDLGLIPVSGRSPGEGNGNPLQSLAWRIPWTEEPDGVTESDTTKQATSFLLMNYFTLKIITQKEWGKKKPGQLTFPSVLPIHQ